MHIVSVYQAKIYPLHLNFEAHAGEIIVLATYAKAHFFQRTTLLEMQQSAAR